MAHDIRQKLSDDNEVTGIKLHLMDNETKIADELLDMLCSLNMPTTGLEKLEIYK